MMLERGLVGLACVLLGCLSCMPVNLSAQDAVTVTGLVLDSVSLVPVVSVEVAIGLRGERVTTNGEGVWAMPGVARGLNTIVLEKEGYRTRIYQFDLPSTVVGEVDVGVVYLTAGPNPTAPVIGTVHSQIGDPVVRASVLLNDKVAALTDDTGSFLIADVPVGIHEFEFRRIGYVPKFATVQIHGDVAVNVTLDALPVELEEIVVDADRTVYATGRMKEFYERRRTGLGRFFTRWDIEKRNPMFVSDLFRAIPGVRLVPGAFGRNRIVMSRQGCSPQVVLDGMPLDNVSVDDLLIPEYIEGIEVYTGVATVPIMFSQMEACGAIVIWTR